MRIPEGSSTRRVLALMGSAMPGLRLVVDREGHQDPAEERRERAARWERGGAGAGAAPSAGCPDLAVLGGMGHGEVCRRIDPKAAEDRPEGLLQAVDDGRAQTRPPTTVDDGGQLGPDLLRPSAGSLGADGGSVLRWVPQWPGPAAG